MSSLYTLEVIEKMNRTQWSSEEISYLTKSYFSGKRIKLIANELNRSNMSVSKALKRFHICFKTASTISNKATPPPTLSKPRIREIQKRFHDDWITISRLVRWMQDQGFNAYPIDKQNKQFYLDTHLITPGQLLLQCNRYRLNNNLSAFRVKGITNV